MFIYLIYSSPFPSITRPVRGPIPPPFVNPGAVEGRFTNLLVDPIVDPAEPLR